MAPREPDDQDCTAPEPSVGIRPPSTLLALLGVEDDDSRFSAVVDRRWLNPWGAAYGGYVAGLMAYAIEASATPGQSLAVFSATFGRPLVAGSAQIEAHVRQSGRSAALVEAVVSQNSNPIAHANAWMTAAGLEPADDYQEPFENTLPDVTSCRPRPHVVGMPGVPDFLEQSIEFLDPPSADHTATSYSEWIRLRDLELSDEDPLPAPALVLLTDLGGAAGFRAGAQWFDRPVDVVTLALTINLLRRPLGPWLAVQLEAEATANGRLATHARYWDRRGRRIASVTQQQLIRPRD